MIIYSKYSILEKLKITSVLRTRNHRLYDPNPLSSSYDVNFQKYIRDVYTKGFIDFNDRIDDIIHMIERIDVPEAIKVFELRAV